jgi:hypothetical protein
MGYILLWVLLKLEQKYSIKRIHEKSISSCLCFGYAGSFSQVIICCSPKIENRQEIARSGIAK